MHAFSATEQQLIRQFITAVELLPMVHVASQVGETLGATTDHGHDARIELQLAGEAVTLLVEAKKSVYPRDVRQLIWHIREARQSQPQGPTKASLSVLVAESISVGAKEVLKEENIGYFDSGGSMYLPAPGAYVYIDKPPPKALAKSVRSLFSGRRAQVLHAMLMRHEDWFGVKELALRAKVSPATTSQVLTELERFDWMAARGQGPNKERRLREPVALLDAWVEQLASTRPPILRRYYVPDAPAEQLLERIGQSFDAHNAEYAISHEAAAQRYSPFLSHVSQVRTRVLIGSNADSAIGDLGARAVNEGANLAIIEAKSFGELLFRERVGGIWLASPVQVYLDLLQGEGRSKEMAAHLRTTRIGF